MKILAIAVGTLLAAATLPATAQTYYYSPTYDPYAAPSECVNRHTGRFEAVRPGEVQDDLDFSRCRVTGARTYRRAYRYAAEECWNPGAGHFEGVRPGERQTDLDFSRCRMIRDDRIAYEPPWRY